METPPIPSPTSPTEINPELDATTNFYGMEIIAHGDTGIISMKHQAWPGIHVYFGKVDEYLNTVARVYQDSARLVRERDQRKMDEEKETKTTILTKSIYPVKRHIPADMMAEEILANLNKEGFDVVAVNDKP